MLSKAISVLVLIQIVAILCNAQKYMIKNKKTGVVLDGAKLNVEIKPWEEKDSQLWTLEQSSKPGHSVIHNVGTGKVLDACPVTKAVLTWPKHGHSNQLWKLDTNGDERLQVAFYPNNYMTHKNGKPILQTTKQNDDSDKWLLVEPFVVPK